MSTTYTANLISHLTLSEPVAPIRSLEEFVASTDWTLALEFGVGAMGDWAVSLTTYLPCEIRNWTIH